MVFYKSFKDLMGEQEISFVLLCQRQGTDLVGSSSFYIEIPIQLHGMYAQD